MSSPPTAADLLRSIGLEVDGPARWGAKPPSRQSGIFAVEMPTPADSAPVDLDEVRRWLERVPGLRLDGARPTQTTLGERLGRFWLPGQTLLYVGRTTKSLSARVASLYATELGHARPHPGGHWLKTLRDQAKLRLWWAETDAPEEYEDELIETFAQAVPADIRGRLPAGAPVLPWANLDSPTTQARETGISGALLPVEVAPARRTGIRRSDSSGRRRRASPASAAAGSPRRTVAKPGSGAAASPATPKREAPTHITADGLVALEAELVRLVDEERPAVIERVKNARELGDLRENADYHAAREEQSFLEGRILQLQQQVRTAVIIESRSGGAVSMGSTVVYEVEGEHAELTIVGSTESDPAAGRISAASPVGKALIGHRPGDDVVVVTPATRMRYRILEVR